MDEHILGRLSIKNLVSFTYRDIMINRNPFFYFFLKGRCLSLTFILLSLSEDHSHHLLPILVKRQCRDLYTFFLRQYPGNDKRSGKYLWYNKIEMLFFRRRGEVFTVFTSDLSNCLNGFQGDDLHTIRLRFKPRKKRYRTTRDYVTREF